MQSESLIWADITICYESEKRKHVVSAEAHNRVIPYRFVTPANDPAARRASLPGTGNKPKNEDRSKKSSHGPAYRGNLESELNRISKETDPQKKADSYRMLLEAAEGDDEIRIKFMLAFVLAEELGDNEAAAVQLNDIIRDSKSKEHVALARQYLAVMDEPRGHSVKVEEGTSRDIVYPGDNMESTRHGDVETRMILKEVRIPSGTGPRVLTWISDPSFDYLEGYMRYERGFFHHSRAILFIKPFCYLLVDRVTTKKGICFKQHFHFPPEVSVIDKGNSEYILESSQGRSCIMKGLETTSAIESEIIRGKIGVGYQG